MSLYNRASVTLLAASWIEYLSNEYQIYLTSPICVGSYSRTASLETFNLYHSANLRNHTYSFPALLELYSFFSNISNSLINHSSCLIAWVFKAQSRVYLPTFLLNQSNQPLPCFDQCLNLGKHKRAFLNFLSKLAWVISLQSQKTCEFPSNFSTELPHIWTTGIYLRLQLPSPSLNLRKYISAFLSNSLT